MVASATVDTSPFFLIISRTMPKIVHIVGVIALLGVLVVLSGCSDPHELGPNGRVMCDGEGGAWLVKHNTGTGHYSLQRIEADACVMIPK